MYENCYQALMVFPDAEVDAVVERLRSACREASRRFRKVGAKFAFTAERTHLELKREHWPKGNPPILFEWQSTAKLCHGCECPGSGGYYYLSSEKYLIEKLMETVQQAECYHRQRLADRRETARRRRKGDPNDEG